MGTFPESTWTFLGITAICLLLETVTLLFMIAISISLKTEDVTKSILNLDFACLQVSFELCFAYSCVNLNFNELSYADFARFFIRAL